MVKQLLGKLKAVEVASTYPSPLDSLMVDDHMFWRGLFVYISLLYIFCNIGYVSELQFISFQKGFYSVLQVSESTLCQCSISNHCNTSPVIKLCSFSLPKWKMIGLQIVKQKDFFFYPCIQHCSPGSTPLHKMAN